MIFVIVAVAMIIPLVWMIYKKQEFTILEFLLSVLFGLFVAFICDTVSTIVNSSDAQIINGRVVNKTRDEVSCSHSYDCRCHTVKTKDGSRRECDTCYEHSYDVDWNVKSDIGSIRIDRIDRRGLKEPPRFTQVKIGEPYSERVFYRNPIKGNPYSLYNKSTLSMVEAWGPKLPEYPEIGDYYRIDRVLTSGFAPKDLNIWQADLSNINRDLNPLKKVNVNLVLTSEKSLDFVQALDAKWIGGKKNDVTAIVSANADQSINWVRVLSYSADSRLKVYLRDHLLEVGTVDREKFMKIIAADVSVFYQHESFRKFDYLSSSTEMSDIAFYVSLIITILSSFWICWFFSQPGTDLYFTKRGW